MLEQNCLSKDAPGIGAVTVEVRDLHLKYEVYADRQITMRQLAARGFRGREATLIHALKGVTLEVRQGEVVGVVGSNGSGKSTLLAAVAGLLPVTTGSVRVRSQPSLLGVNASLKKELSGYRNIELGGLALGLPLAVIRSELPAIAEFTGLGEALERPMRTYSSGMRARLAFSVATLRTPEILLIDEALAVGDRTFRRRSWERIREMQAQAGTILMVTHNLREIRDTCTRAVWIEQGVLKMDGPVDAVLAAYET